jgi:hypothetical protein
MDCWFTTSDGNTLHNNPTTIDYVPGELPKFPLTLINYREECLVKGFARAGWPNTGDLRPECLGNGRLAPEGYSLPSLLPATQTMLQNFASIRAGDLIIIPADEGYMVHIGIVLTRERKVISPTVVDRVFAYYYFHNIAAGDFYECAHRVNVIWATDKNGEPKVCQVKGLSGIWRRAGGKINDLTVKNDIVKTARNVNLY